jgi:hypothetical protein
LSKSDSILAFLYLGGIPKALDGGSPSLILFEAINIIFVILTIRYTARPLSNVLKGVMKSSGFGHKFMIMVGNKAYNFEN